MAWLPPSSGLSSDLVPTLTRLIAYVTIAVIAIAMLVLVRRLLRHVPTLDCEPKRRDGKVQWAISLPQGMVPDFAGEVTWQAELFNAEGKSLEVMADARGSSWQEIVITNPLTGQKRRRSLSRKLPLALSFSVNETALKPARPPAWLKVMASQQGGAEPFLVLWVHSVE